MNKKIYYVKISLLFLAVIQTFLGYNSYAYDTEKCNTTILKNGFYMSDYFIDELKQMRKGVESSVDSKRISAIVVNGNSTKSFMFIWNMHEGDIDRLSDIDCLLTREDHAKELSGEIYKLSIKSPHKFTITKNLKEVETFNKVKSLDEEIAKTIITGEYIDTFGNIYIFNKNGELKINENYNKYRMIVDKIEFNSYVLVIYNKTNPENLYEMHWKNNNVFLKKIPNEETTIHSPNDIVLTPLK